MTRALDILLQRAEQARDQAQAEWQQGQARVRALQQQAQQLLGYSQETAARDPTRDGRSTTIDSLLVHRSFMQRLQQAVALQQTQLDHAQLQAQALQADLLALEMRVTQVQKLKQRRHQEDLRQLDRQDQRRSDDATQQRLHLHRAQAAATAETVDTAHPADHPPCNETKAQQPPGPTRATPRTTTTEPNNTAARRPPHPQKPAAPP